jgi:uncharacterized oligopeptide transporter (OPT) family protein
MSDQSFKPYVPAEQSMKEISFKAILLGIIMAIVLGAANAYLGLLVGMTVAATFPAAVIAMAVLRPLKGTILEENFARTTGAVGEALAAGAIFTIPAFLFTGVWTKFDVAKSSMLMLVGGILGVFLIILVRCPAPGNPAGVRRPGRFYRILYERKRYPCHYTLRKNCIQNTRPLSNHFSG